MSKLFRLQEFELRRIVSELSTTGAASVHLLNEGFRLALLQEAQSYPYTPEAEVVGTGNQTVRQQLSSFGCFPEATQYRSLREAFQNLLDERLASFETYPFATKLELNSMVLQKYEQGSLGITPHRDRLSSINLVCIFNIGGQGRFCVCEDRSGSHARVIDSSPGSVVFLRAPGFMSSPERPFHYVTNIPATRYTFGLRQKTMPSGFKSLPL